MDWADQERIIDILRYMDSQAVFAKIPTGDFNRAGQPEYIRVAIVPGHLFGDMMRFLRDIGAVKKGGE